MKQIPCTYMRGGTSKGCVFLQKDLPTDRSTWDALFVAAMGGRDPKQIDGMGGCVSSNNKIIVVSRSRRPGIDVEYLVGQCVVGEGRIDYSANCGNMTAAVAPFAVEHGLLDNLTAPRMTVHLYNLNTDQCIDVELPISDGHFNNTGVCRIAGIEAPAGELRMTFLDPAGSKTGVLFPTGNRQDIFSGVTATLLDVSVPTVLVPASEVGMSETEMPVTINENAMLLHRLESIRADAAYTVGMATSPRLAAEQSAGAPKIGVLCPPIHYKTLNGQDVNESEIDICVRVISMGKAHKACPLTAANAIAAAALLPGTLVHALCRPLRGNTVRIGHPSGVMEVTVDIRRGQVLSATTVRTARTIMDGMLYLPE